MFSRLTEFGEMRGAVALTVPIVGNSLALGEGEGPPRDCADATPTLAASTTSEAARASLPAAAAVASAPRVESAARVAETAAAHVAHVGLTGVGLPTRRVGGRGAFAEARGGPRFKCPAARPVEKFVPEPRSAETAEQAAEESASASVIARAVSAAVTGTGNARTTVPGRHHARSAERAEDCANDQETGEQNDRQPNEGHTASVCCAWGAVRRRRIGD